MTTPRRPPGRRELKSVILWAARMLVSEDGGETLYSESIRVKIEKTDEAEAMVVEPRRGLDGLAVPEQLRQAPDADVGAPELLRVLLGDSERVLVADLLEHGPCQATQVLDRCRAKVGKSDFWPLWGSLQSRGLVVQGDDDLYRVGPPWVREVVFGKKDEGKKPAA